MGSEVNPSELDPSEPGQYVEVLNKDPKDSLLAALDKVILEAGDSLQNCTVNTSQQIYGWAPYTGYSTPYNYQVGDIESSDTNEGTVVNNNLSGLTKPCPPTYTSLSNISYFAFDPNYPDKLLFINSGVYPVYADLTGDLTWDETIKFL
ncbi:MAG: hypothetical protein ACYDER_01440 [Ktedonobacteraceae bacterium]